jgi:hypothetical protein
MSIRIASVKGSRATLEITTPGMLGGSDQVTEIEIDNRGRTGKDEAAGIGIVELPQGSLKVGGSWQQERSLADPLLGTQLDVSSTYTLKSVRQAESGLVADIVEKGTLKGATAEGSIDGVLVLDGKDGFIRYYQTVTKMSLSLEGQAFEVEVLIKLLRKESGSK